MFEKSEPPFGAHARRIPARDRVSVDSATAPADGASLRAIEWGELVARLGAARDFRQLLRDDTHVRNALDGEGFADAAARYFRAREAEPTDHRKIDDCNCDNRERDVNPVALEHRKGSSGIVTGSKKKPSETTPKAEHAAQGDAREEQ